MNRRAVALLALSLLVALAWITPPGTANTPQLTPQHLVDKAAATGKVRVIVELGGTGAVPERLLSHIGAIMGQRSSISQAQADLRWRLRNLTHQVRREFATMPYVALEVSPAALSMLEAMRGIVTRIDEDGDLQPVLAESGPIVQAPTAWAAGVEGVGQTIAVIDDGIDKNHEFFPAGKVVAEACYVSTGCPNGMTSQIGPGAGLPCTGCTHGTHVAGIAAGNGTALVNRPSGVARGANLMAIRVFNAGGSATFADVVFGLERVYLLRNTHSFAAVNMSLGVKNSPRTALCDAQNPAMTTVISNLRNAGIATVIASGNDSFTNAASFPACISWAVSVGSTDDGSQSTTVDRVSSFSNIAPYVTLLAPGKWITSSYPGNIYREISGTSMAAPHVAGAFALLKEVAPNATVTDLVNALRNTGTLVSDTASAERPFAVGTTVARINVGNAVATMPTVQFELGTYPVAEAAGTATISVTRSGPNTGTATVTYATSNGTALSGTHYTATSGTLTFNPGEVTKTFAVPIVDNTVVNADRTVNLRLSGPSGATLGAPATAVLTISNDDNGGAIALGAATYSVNENGGFVTIDAVRTGTSLASAVTVRYATANGTAIAGPNYTAKSGTLTFGAGVATASIGVNVPIIDNTSFAGDKTFQVSLSAPGGGGVLGTPAAATVTIVENDSPGTFQFSSPTYSVNEGAGSATMTVTRTGSSLAGGIVIGYATTTGGTATAGADYTAKTGTLTFAANVTSMTFAVPVTNDAAMEPDETVALALSVPPGSPGILGAQSTATLTIVDNDAPTFKFALASQAVAEGATANLMVSRTGSPTPVVTVDYAVTGGSATAGDYTVGGTGTLTFNAGVTSLPIPVSTVNDTLAEGAETVVVSLGNPSPGAAVGAPASTTLTLTDNDNPGVIQFGSKVYSVSENVASGVVTLNVTRTGTSLASNVTVDYAVTGGTATGSGVGADYTLANGTLMFAAGQTSPSQPLTVNIHDDGAGEGDETVVVTLSNPSSGATLGLNPVATLTILDDEQALSFSAATYTAVEGTPSISIPVLRAGPTPAGTTVNCDAVGPGAAGTSVTRLLTFPAGARSVPCIVPLANNTLVDGPKTVDLTLTIPPGSPGLPGNQATALLTVNDEDQGGSIRFGALTYAVAEGGTASLVVVRSGKNLASNVTVDYTVTGGTASNGALTDPARDFTLAPTTFGTLTFNAGITSLPITVPTFNDTLAEGPETVVVTLSNPTGGGALGTPVSATLTITDNDSPGTLQFSVAASSVVENVPAGGPVNLLVTRAGSALASGISVDYAVIGGTATGNAPGSDYTLAAGTLTFAAGQTSLPIPVTINDDSAGEGNETVIVQLSNPAALSTLGTTQPLPASALGATKITTLTILDDEQSVSFSAPTYTVVEGIPSVSIPILRTGPTPAGTTVGCQTTAGGSAVQNFDYRAVNATLTYAAGSRSVSCVVPILNDTFVDGPKTLNLGLVIPAGSPALLGPQATSVLTINDNDQVGTFRFAAATYTVTEGVAGALTVTRSGTNLAGGVTVNYAVTGGGATEGTDFTLGGGTLTFNANQTSATIPVTPLTDLLFEGNETFVVTLVSDAAAPAAIDPLKSSTTVTLRDATRAMVRFVNDLVVCFPCRAFTARLTAEEGYTWSSTTGTPSPYQNVRHATLSNFVGIAVGVSGAPPLLFPGTFPITADRRYILVVTVDDASSQVVLLVIDEGPIGAALGTADGAGSQVTSITAQGLPAGHYAGAQSSPAPTR